MAGDWDAVAKAIHDRLDELTLSTRELSRKARVGESTVRELRYNVAQRRRHPATLSRLSEGLEWPPDQLERVLTGGSVTLRGKVEGGTVADAAVHQRLDAIETTLLEVLTVVQELRGRGDRDADR